MAIQNRTGTISGTESWDFSADEYHATGDITVTGAVTITIPTATNNPFRFNGAYYFRVFTGSIVANGTQAKKITWQANANPRRGAWTHWWFDAGVAAGCSMTFNVLRHAGGSGFGIVMDNTTAVTMNDVEIVDSLASVAFRTGKIASTHSRIRIIRSPQTVTIGTANTQTLNDWDFSQTEVMILTITAGSHTINGLRFNGGFSGNAALIGYNTAGTLTGDEWYIGSIAVETVRCTGGIMNLNGCVLDNRFGGQGILVRVGGTLNSTNNDCVNCGTALNTGLYAVSSSDGDYLEGGNGAAPGQVDTDSGNTTSTSTPTQYRLLGANRLNARATPNKPLTTSSVSSGSITSSGATITWTSGIKSSSIVRYGTVSGTYTMRSVETENDWTGLDGGTKHATAHSVALVNLAPGTTYYYQVGGFDPISREITWSAEGSFTTTAAASGGAARSSFISAGMGVS